MQRKILSFIYDGSQFLLLHSKPHPKHGKGGWYTVTGGIEGNETDFEAVRREIKEETGLDTITIISLDRGCTYEWDNQTCQENYHISLVKKGEILLNEEHDAFKWVNLNDFIEFIEWNEDKEELRKDIKEKMKIL
jgi:8-oxo-dGTP pyrophosphatase MutT (NUDIX family)